MRRLEPVAVDWARLTRALRLEARGKFELASRDDARRAVAKLLGDRCIVDAVRALRSAPKFPTLGAGVLDLLRPRAAIAELRRIARESSQADTRWMARHDLSRLQDLHHRHDDAD